MKREIKFKFWLGHIKKMSLNHYLDDILKIGWDLSHNIVPLQFIGLTDKNGIEIYEGDYLIDRYPVDEEDSSKGYHESLLPVVWCDKQLMWCVDVSFVKDGSYLTSLAEYFGEFLEIKGNIYES